MSQEAAAIEEPGGNAEGQQDEEEEDDCWRREPDYEVSFDAMRKDKGHPLRMKVLWEEIYLAEAIKARIQEQPELDLPSDYMCVQLALTCNEDIDLAVAQVEALQDFRKLYGFVESYQDGCRAIQRFFDIFPESLPSFHLNSVDGSYLYVQDMSKWDTTSTNPNLHRDFLVGTYYLLQAAHPDFHSIHKGLTAVVDCMGMDWTNRRALKLFNRFAKELPPIYPHNVSSISHYNTPAVFNVIAHAAKKMLPTKMRDKFKFGLSSPCPLANIYMVPDPATARQRRLYQLQENLKRRFENEEKFSLARSNCEAIIPNYDDEVEVLGEARGLIS